MQGLEASIREIGKALSDAYPSVIRHPVRTVDQRMMQLVTDRPDVRAALFRFVDATPACRTPEELTEHLTALLGEVEDPPVVVRAPEALGRVRVGEKLVGSVAAAGVKHLAQRFIVGESPRTASGHLAKLWRDGASATLDLLGEATVTQDEADHYAARCADAITTFAGIVPAWPARPALERDFAGPIPRANVSVKVSALTPLIRSQAPELGADDAARRLVPLLHQARDAGVHLHIDMESVDTLETTMHLVLDLLAEPGFRDGPSAGVVIQAYLRESPALVDRVLEWVRSNPRTVPLTIRLVKGAYWDHEVAEARQRGWVPPVFTEKADSDRNFEHLTRTLIDARPGVRLGVASHNLRSVSHAIAYNRLTGGQDADIEIQVLQGLGDDLTDALTAHGIRTRVYCPVGDLVMGMAYLVRRLLENTASTSVLAAHGRGVPIDQLLTAP